MSKKLFIVLALLLCNFALQAQTFKITDVQATDKKLWNAQTKALLGKSFKLTFFDRTVRVQFPNQKPLVLSKSSGEDYSGLDDMTTERETLRWNLVKETTVGVLTSVTVTFSISEEKPPYRSARLTITGKRF